MIDRQGKLPYDYYSHPWEAEANDFGESNSTENDKQPLPSGGYNFIWRGPGDVGSEMGEWFNPKTGDQLHPNLNHLPPKKPHWGWRNKLKRILLDIFKN